MTAQNRTEGAVLFVLCVVCKRNTKFEKYVTIREKDWIIWKRVYVPVPVAMRVMLLCARVPLMRSLLGARVHVVASYYVDSAIRST